MSQRVQKVVVVTTTLTPTFGKKCYFLNFSPTQPRMIYFTYRSPTHSYMFTSNVLVLVYSKVIFNCGRTEIESCFLVEHPSHVSMLSHRRPKFDCPRQCLNVFVIKRGVKLWWSCKFLIAILDWLSPLSCDSDSWAKCRHVRSIILSTNDILYSVDLLTSRMLMAAERQLDLNACCIL